MTSFKKRRRYKTKGAIGSFDFLITVSAYIVLLAIAVPSAIKIIHVVKDFACKSEMVSIKSALELWQLKYHEYPSSIKDLVNEGFISEKALTDPWDNEYVYRVIYQNKKNTAYTIFSMGKDGIQGTEDDVKAEN